MELPYRPGAWLFAFIAFALPLTNAYADTDVTGTLTAQHLLADAQAYWHRTPDCVNYRVLEGPITDQPPGVEAEGEAPIPGCFMRITERSWNAAVYPGESHLCAIVIHEYGHSLGEPHNTNPLSVMNPEVAFSTGKPPACTQIEVEEAAAANAHIMVELEREEAHYAALYRERKHHSNRRHRHARLRHHPHP